MPSTPTPAVVLVPEPGASPQLVAMVLGALAVRRIRPPVHVFGHIHEAYGVSQDDGVLSINAAMVGLGPVSPEQTSW